MPIADLLNKAFQRYWRLSRGTTLGAEALVIDGAGRLLFVEEQRSPGWRLPGAPVARGETAEEALARALKLDAGITLSARPELFSVYANFGRAPAEQIALYMVRHWKRLSIPEPDPALPRHAFFARAALPAALDAAALRRIDAALDRDRASPAR